MTDEAIITLFWDRSETAISATAERYGGFLTKIAAGILRQREDTEECVNDTYLTAWNQIPPDRPQSLSAYLGRIVRCLALNRFDYRTAKKRNSEFDLRLEELEECVAGAGSPEERLELAQVGEAISAFLRTQKKESRQIFVRRYWYSDTVSELAERFGISESKVKSSLFRTRNGLREYLRKEGYTV